MHAYQATRPVIDAVWARVSQRADDYPARIADLSRTFFGSVGPAYFSQRDAAPILHLPAWLARDVPEHVLLSILEGTALAYAYVRVQDNVIDEPDTRGNAALLLAANAWLWDARELWGQQGDPVFVRLSREAWLSFSDETESERRQLTQPVYAAASFVTHARKCALAEIPLYACMAAAQDWSGVEHVTPLVHALALSYGRFNDVTGVDRDLASGANTYLISQARERTTSRGDDVRAIRHVLQTSGIIEEFLGAAALDLQRAIPHARALGMPQFEAYAAERSQRLLQMRDGYALVRLAAVLAA